jgi:GR25 family glycosyltransferase involved in LPS biosynthesis
MQGVPIFCLTYKNPVRKNKMIHRFKLVNLDVNFVEGIDPYDQSIVPPAEIIEKAKTLDRWKPHSGYGCMYGHFIAIKQFLDTGNEIGIICEDDVMLRKDFAEELPIIIANFERQNLDVLMLGYLNTTDAPARVVHNKPLKSAAFSYHNYDTDVNIWGTQMYMIRRSHAEFLYHNYGPQTDYKIRSLVDVSLEHWIADCLITKIGNRAMISPMMAIEEGIGSWAPNQPIHGQTFQINFDPTIHF